MSLLRSIDNRWDRIEEKINKLSSSFYNVSRNDESYDLVINYFDRSPIKIPFTPLRLYQNDLRKALFQDGIKRILIEWPRRSGKEYACFELLIEGAIVEPGLYMMVYPTNVRARAILWEGYILLQDGSTLPFLKMIPKELVAKIDNQAMKVHLVNGSIIWIVGSDIDPDKLRGTNPRGICYAEFAFQDPKVFYIMLPVLRQNGGWLIGQSTFDGMNHFWHLIENNKNDPLWYCKVESITTLVDENGDRYITDEMIEEDRRAGMPEYLIQQEYYGVVQINQETKYFAHAIKNIYETSRIKSELILPNANVYSAFDIGMNDCTAITLFQVKRVDDYLKPIIIGYIESNNQQLQFYVTEIRRFCNRYNLLFKDHFIPHDGQKRDFNTGKNTIDFLRDMNENGYIVPRPSSKNNAIEAMRRQLYLCEFNRENTPRLIDCLSNYSKEYDDKMNDYKSKPVHNWASHGVDSFQTMTLALDGGMISDRVYDVIYIN